MDPKKFFENQWKYLLSMLPAEVDLEATARASGALVLPRVIREAQTLLRMVLVYGCCSLSLRQTSLWMAQQGLGEISAVAVRKRLQQSVVWMEQLLSAKLAERAGLPSLGQGRLRLVLVDATTSSMPGSEGTDWRLHVGFDLGSMSIHAAEVTGSEGGESLSRFSFKEGEVVVADRGYSQRQGMGSVVQAGALFLLRPNWHNLPLEGLGGERFDLFESLRQVGEAEVKEFAVQTVATKEIPAIPARLVVLRKSPEAAEQSRRKIIREKKKKGRKVNPLALEAAGYFMVLTSIPQERLTAAEVLEVYRYRWQIEMAFKRLKHVLPLRQVPAKDPSLARVYLLANLLAALLIEDLTRNFLAFSPWGYRLRLPAQPVAHGETLRRRCALGPSGCDVSGGVVWPSPSTLPLPLRHATKTKKPGGGGRRLGSGI